MLKDLLEKSGVPHVSPIVDPGLGNSSYVVDLGDGGALVVDPERDPRPYLREMRERSLEPRYVVETHLHADFVSGSRELVEAGAELCAPSGSDLSFPHRRLHDDEVLDLGGLTLQVIATPGHTPEHLAYLLHDDGRPVALFSGGTLMAGGVARTDLLTADQTEPLARDTYRSVIDRLFTLPDDVAVYPTHGGGSFCSVGSGGERTTTIGREKALNPLFADVRDEDGFVRRLLASYGSYPPYFLELRDVNREGVETFGEDPPPLRRMSISDFDGAVDRGAVVVDVRDIRSFANGHVPGSISNPWRPQFATWLGWILPRDTAMVFVADETVDRRDLAWAALNVGFENLVGELDGGMDTWGSAGRDGWSVNLTDRELGDGHVIDVRQMSEYRAGHLPDAIHIELGALTDSEVEIPEGPLLIHCGHGERAMTASSLLSRAGHHDITVLEGPPQKLGQLVSADDQ